ncbi:hypothetical protein L1887_42082 [Cichorium endivia]|nr:hypothetical protein L1887_42082 [Cichorium endivia]
MLGLASLSDSHVVQLYEWAESSPAAVLTCTCRQVIRLPTIPRFSHALGGQNLFLHHQTPCLFVHVCGMIVGVQPKDDHIAYETPEPPSGIPECYRMPPQPKTSRPGYGDASSSTSTLSPPQPRFNVADVVMCVGKVQIARDGGRFIVAKSLASSRDLNDESRHQIKAVELDNNLYRQPFDWNRIQADVKASLATQPTTTSLSRPSARSLLTDASLEHGVDVLPSFAPHRDKHESIPDTRLTRDEARKLLASDTPSSPIASTSGALPVLPRSSGTSRRKLRSQAKIPDHSLTESYFQLQLQHHIVQHYPHRPFALSDLGASADLASLAHRLVDARMQLRSTTRRTHATHSAAQASSEQTSDKIRRLFEWALRKMMHDGFIVLSASTVPRSSTSGAANSDSYRLVTPDYLLGFLRDIIGAVDSQPPPDHHHVLARLRSLDERFRFLNPPVVQDSIAVYLDRYAPIVLD